MSSERHGRRYRNTTSAWTAEGEAILDEDSILRPGPVRSVDGWVLFVTGLHEEAREDDIEDKFSEVGRVTHVRMNFDRRTGRGKGYAFVEYGTQSQAQDAINKLHGIQFHGKTIAVHWAFVRPTGQHSGRHG